MAEIVGLAASIVQLGGAGAELSIKLYNFVNSAAKADLDIIDLAEDLDSTGSALGHIGKTLEAKDIQALASRQAIDDAAKIKKRCELVFTEIKEVIGKRRKVGKDGKETLTLAGKMGWPLKEQRVELLRRRLDSLKLSLSLLLDVLKFAQGEAQGKLRTELENERQTIRELYKQRENAFRRERALEARINKLRLENAGSVPMLNAMSHAQSMGPVAPSIASQSQPSHPQIDANAAALNPLDPNFSDGNTTTTDDEGEHLTLDELAVCAAHVQYLLQRITVLQKSLQTGQLVKHHRKRRMHKTYLRFCRRFEANFVDAEDALSATSLLPSRASRNVMPAKATSKMLGTVLEPVDGLVKTPVLVQRLQEDSHASAQADHVQRTPSSATTTLPVRTPSVIEPSTVSVPVLSPARRLRRRAVEAPERATNSQAPPSFKTPSRESQASESSRRPVLSSVSSRHGDDENRKCTIPACVECSSDAMPYRGLESARRKGCAAFNDSRRKDPPPPSPPPRDVAKKNVVLGNVEGDASEEVRVRKAAELTKFNRVENLLVEPQEAHVAKKKAERASIPAKPTSSDNSGLYKDSVDTPQKDWSPKVAPKRRDSRKVEECTSGPDAVGPRPRQSRRQSLLQSSQATPDVSYPHPHDTQSQVSGSAQHHPSSSWDSRSPRTYYSPGGTVIHPAMSFPLSVNGRSARPRGEAASRVSSRHSRTSNHVSTPDYDGSQLGAPVSYPRLPPGNDSPLDSSAYGNISPPQSYPLPYGSQFYQPQPMQSVYETQRPSLSARLHSSTPNYSNTISPQLPPQSKLQRTDYHKEEDEEDSESDSGAEDDSGDEYEEELHPRLTRKILSSLEPRPPKAASKSRPKMRHANITPAPPLPGSKRPQAVVIPERRELREHDHIYHHRPSRRTSVSRRSLVPAIKSKSTYDTPRARVLVEGSKTSRRESRQSYNRSYAPRRGQQHEYNQEQGRQKGPSQAFDDVVVGHNIERELYDDEDELDTRVPLRRRNTDTESRRRHQNTPKAIRKTDSAEDYINARRGERDRYADQPYSIAKYGSTQSDTSSLLSGTEHQAGNDEKNFSTNKDARERILDSGALENFDFDSYLHPEPSTAADGSLKSVSNDKRHPVIDYKHTMPEYNKSLMLLEQQGKKRLAEVLQEERNPDDDERGGTDRSTLTSSNTAGACQAFCEDYFSDNCGLGVRLESLDLPAANVRTKRSDLYDAGTGTSSAQVKAHESNFLDGSQAGRNSDRPPPVIHQPSVSPANVSDRTYTTDKDTSAGTAATPSESTQSDCSVKRPRDIRRKRKIAPWKDNRARAIPSEEHISAAVGRGARSQSSSKRQRTRNEGVLVGKECVGEASLGSREDGLLAVGVRDRRIGDGSRKLETSRFESDLGEVGGRDIVDVLLEQWTVPVAV